MTSQYRPPEPKPTVTFVTAFMNIYDRPLHNVRDVAWRFDHFAKIVETGIPICVYVDPKSEEYMRQFIDLISADQDAPLVRIMRIVDIKETWIHQECLKFGGDRPPKMPLHRTLSKDTYEYMTLMHSKVEFLKDAIEQNPWSTTHFAWIDFNIWHIFREHEMSQDQLRQIAYSPIKTTGVLIPGCWAKMEKNDSLVPDAILGKIHWRFCGGFFLGHQDQILDLWEKYAKYWPEFMVRYSGPDGAAPMVWEVNFWAWLEAFCDWTPQWYSADHDDRIIQIPMDTMTPCLVADFDAKVETYPYKDIGQFYPMSASFALSGDGKSRILNTRYVNYRLTPQGAYIFNDPNRVISSKNVFSVLDNQWRPVSYQEIADPGPHELPSKPIPQCPFNGIEDIRIFCPDPKTDRIQFIGTSINYSHHESNRMIMGEYDLAKYQMHDCFLLDSPEGSGAWCEKNWCPVICEGRGVEYVYKWNPVEIGHLVDSVAGSEEVPRKKRLVITCKHHVNAPVFRRFRGSTSFVESIHFPGFLIGVVHFSMNEWPRHYYHALVLLDRVSLKPRYYTNIFTLCKSNSIEFCIGFSETGEREYIFWISQYDRDSCMVQCPMDRFSWLPC